MALPASQWVLDGKALNVAKNSETSLAATPHALSPSLAFRGTIPYVAWAEINDKGISLIYVKHKEGKEWVLAGGPLNLSPARYASIPTLAAIRNNLCVAWSEVAPNNVSQVYVKELKGKEWDQTGQSLNMDQAHQASNPVIAGNKSGIFAAWTEISSTGVSEIYVKQWDGSSWRLIGDRLNKSVARHALTPALAAGKDGVYLAWTEYDNNGISQLYVNHWNGKTWEDLGKVVNISPERHTLSPSISIAGSTPYVAWMEYDAEGVSRIYVKRWNGKEWVQIGGSLNMDSTRHATSPSLAMKGSIPYVVWTEIDGSGTPEIDVKHWKGTLWAQDGPYLNTNPGMTATTPSIAIKDEAVYVAFSEIDTNNIYQLYIKKLEGKGDVPATTSLKYKETSPLQKGDSSRTFFTKIPPGAAGAEVLPPPLAYKYLPKTRMGKVSHPSPRHYLQPF